MNGFRLTGAYVAIMLAGLLLFAAAAVLAIDRAQHSTLDARLRTSARAALQFVDVGHERIELDASDREQIQDVIEPQTNAAVLDSDGTVLFSTSAHVPKFTSQDAVRPVFFDSRDRRTPIRVYALPVLQHSIPVGAVIVWGSSGWIDETDRNLALALGALAFVIAGLALFAGSLVTRRALDDAFARQRRFTADASHELRAPLAVIRAEADLALRKERDPQAYRNAMQTIASEADHMESLIGDLLSAARAESGNLMREPAFVAPLLQSIADRLHAFAAAKDAVIEVDAPEEARIVVDAPSLERALLAIGHNAVKYAEERGTVLLKSVIEDRTVEIVIRDSGPGFSAEALRHALERFWREPGSRAGTGTGLGLAIARSIVEANHGAIELANVQGGAEVRLRFPSA